MKLLMIGAGEFGCFYAQFFKTNGFEVTITDCKEDKAREAALKKEFSVMPCVFEKQLDFDVVVLALPEKAAVELSQKISPFLKPGALMADTCSIKSRICKALEEIKRKDIELASIHPMHGPRVTSIVGFPIIFIELITGEKTKELKKLFQESGARVVESNALEHDRMIAVVQGLTHYMQILSAKTLDFLNIDLERSLMFASPVYELYLDLIARVVLQNPRLYAEIQLSNEFNDQIRDAITKCNSELQEICKERDFEKLENQIYRTSFLFDNKDFFLFSGDKAVSAIKLEAMLLKSLEGKTIMLENLLTKKIHYGQLLSYDPKRIKFKENEQEISINAQKVRLLTKDEGNEWKKKSLKVIHKDFSMYVPQCLRPEVLAKMLSKTTGFEFTVFEEFFPKEKSNEKSVTLRASLFNDENIKVTEKEIQFYIECLGLKIR
ncbi:MAG: prephenate dehydrogenase/arogenate dehydrogenase family protein [Candidatus Diapherotrites archaeon]|nr:prephenate dehydrogenase/arogenate dehydrogenase family protein [Candidatus Diapherotrites archaeon]